MMKSPKTLAPKRQDARGFKALMTQIDADKRTDSTDSRASVRIRVFQIRYPCPK